MVEHWIVVADMPEVWRSFNMIKIKFVEYKSLMPNQTRCSGKLGAILLTRVFYYVGTPKKHSSSITVHFKCKVSCALHDSTSKIYWKSDNCISQLFKARMRSFLRFGKLLGEWLFKLYIHLELTWMSQTCYWDSVYCSHQINCSVVANCHSNVI